MAFLPPRPNGPTVALASPLTHTDEMFILFFFPLLLLFEMGVRARNAIRCISGKPGRGHPSPYFGL